MRLNKSRGASRLLAACGPLFLLAGCGEEERPLSFTPGVYEGAPDAPISDAARAELEERVSYQGAL